jgi:3-methyladenine DNA glycosylase AlkC
MLACSAQSSNTKRRKTMAEPFKNFYSVALIAQMGAHLARVSPDFNAAGFITMASDNLDALELKQRASHIQEALDHYLPSSFSDAVETMLASLHPETDVELSNRSMDDRGIRGWAVMPMSELVGLRCEQDFDLALGAQKQLTKRFSSEFGIRYSILADPERALETILGWTDDTNYHVRRLASEGTRPRLPWAMQLPSLIADPTPALPILEALKDDPSEYVRRSVSNHLNDISKDHPDLVARIASEWMLDADAKRKKTVRHACRSLIKSGHPETLTALGFGEADIALSPIRVLTETVAFGEALAFEAVLKSTSAQRQNLVIDYVIHFRKANGVTAPKVFKLKTLKLEPGARVVLTRRHAIRPITTRRYYDGPQAVELQINGKTFGQTGFELTGVAQSSG